MLIRTAKPEDAAGIAQVNVRGRQTAFVPFFAQEFLRRISVEQRAERWLRSLSGGATFQTLVAEEGGRILGFAGFGPTEDDLGEDVGEVSGLYVDPDFWDRGIGSALLGAVEEGMAQAGFKRAVLWTIAAYERTRAFYGHRGWQPDGATKHHGAGAELFG